LHLEILVVTGRPEQSSPNAFEVAILQAMARERPSLELDFDHLAVRRRKYTGVGSYTDFLCDSSGERGSFELKAPLTVPGVPKGMGAVLFCRGQRPECLETFTCGEDYWTGASEGFSVG
jgi:hypothetical protein